MFRKGGDNNGCGDDYNDDGLKAALKHPHEVSFFTERDIKQAALSRNRHATTTHGPFIQIEASNDTETDRGRISPPVLGQHDKPSEKQLVSLKFPVPVASTQQK